MGYWVDDPNGGPSIYHEGFDPAKGQQSEGPGQHTPWWKIALDQSKYYAAPFGAAGLEALAAPAIAALPSLGVPVGSTLLPGSLAASTAVPVSSLVAPGLVAGVTGAGATAGANAAAGGVVGGGAAGTGAAGAGTGAGAGTTAGTTAAGVGTGLLPRILNAAGPAIAALNRGQQGNRDVDNFNAQQQDQSELARAILGSQNIERDLAQRIYLDNNYQRQSHNAVYGGMLQGAQDVNITGLPEGVQMGNVTGGARPSMFVGRQEIGGNLQRNALPVLANPPGIDSLPKIPDVPPLTPLRGAGAAERASGWGSALLPLLGIGLDAAGVGRSNTPTGFGLNVGSQLLSDGLRQRTGVPMPTPPEPFQANPNVSTGNAGFINPNTGRRF